MGRTRSVSPETLSTTTGSPSETPSGQTAPQSSPPHAHAPLGPAVARGNALGADESLHAGRGSQPAREPDPEGRLADLDHQCGQEQSDSPACREPDGGDDDGDEEGYSGTIRTEVPIRTWSKSQVASGMNMRMQPWEAE